MAFETETEIESAIEAALDKGTFDVFAHVRGTSLPTDSVVVYTDADAALKLSRIFEEEAARKANADDYSIADEPVADEDEISALHERLLETALTFNLRGVAPKAVEAIEKHLKATHEFKEGTANESFAEEFNNTLIAKSIQSVTRADGATSDTTWGWEQVKDLSSELYPSEANKLFIAAAQLTYVGGIFDLAANADF